MSDVFKEVDEDLRRDQLDKLWRRYGAYVIAGAIAIVLATAAYVYWQNYRLKQVMAEGDAFFQAVMLRSASQEREAAQAFSALADRSSDGYGMLARFNEAGTLADRGELAQAVDIYDRLSSSASDRTLRDIATLCSVSLSLDTVDPAELKARLDPIAAPDNPLRFSARELLALLALRKGDFAVAKQMFTELSTDKSVPQGIRTRAQEMLPTFGS